MSPPPHDPLGWVEAQPRDSQGPYHAVWEEGLDHQHTARLTAGTHRGPERSRRVRALGDAERLGGRWPPRHGQPEQLTAPGELGLADTVGEEAIMSDSWAPTGEPMEQEPPEKLDGIEGHQPLTMALGGVLPATGHPSVLSREEATLRDRHARRRACARFPDPLGRPTGPLRIHPPLVAAPVLEEPRPPRGLGQGLARPRQRQDSAGRGLPEPL